MTFLELAEERYSCRYFSQQAVEQEKIDAILKAAQAAPTAVDKQPFKIFLAADEKAAAVREAARIRFVTPLILIVGADPGQAW